MSTWLVTSVGVVAVVFVLFDMFHTLANPGALGRLGRAMLGLSWRVSRRSHLSGPVAMLAVVVIWGAISILGWAAIYWPHIDDGFSSVASDVDGNGIVDALYVSLVTISTLGLGDVVRPRRGCGCSTRWRRCSDSPC